MRKRVFFVEDDDVIRENYAELLADAGFEIEAFGDHHAALACAQESIPDLALLDISMNDERDAGFQLCADLRRLSLDLPIIFLSCHDSEYDKISGIRLGADDYLTKDTSLDYLIVRMEALLRRVQILTRGDAGSEQNAENKLVRGSLNIEHDKLAVYWQGQKVDLTLTQFRITQALAAHPNQVKSCSKLMKAADIFVEPNTITAHIKTIRDRFKAIDPGFEFIKTERGCGYRWVEA